jgi:hypothetical protein
MWKEVIWPDLIYCPDIFLEELRQTTELSVTIEI